MDEATNTDSRGETLTLLDAALIVLENLRLLVIIPVACGFAALVITFAISPIYTATTRILPPTQSQNLSAALMSQLGSLGGLLGGAAGIKNPGDQYVAFLKSRTVFDAIIGRFNLRERYDERYIEDIRKELAKRSTISAGAKDGVISIEVEDEDPKRAAELANAFVDELKALTNVLAVSEAAQRRLFFENQIKKARDQLTSAEVALRKSGVSEGTLKAMPQAALEPLA